MAVKTKEEILETIKARVGNDNSDDTIAMIEDISDTFDNLYSTSNVDWQRKYNENDAAWRAKYRERFFKTKTDDDVDAKDDNRKDQPLKFEDLFKEG